MQIFDSMRGLLSLVTIGAVLFPTVLAAAEPAAVTGMQGVIVLSPGGQDPSAGRPLDNAIVRATEVASGRTFSSAASDRAGAYSLTGLAPGSYALAIQTGRGVYLSDSVVSVAQGKLRRVSFALREEAEPEGGTGGTGEKAKPKSGNYWADHPWIAGLTVVGTAAAFGFLADALTDEKDEQEPPASPSDR